jgi:predicted acylesterase/phospholipase RssA
MTWDLILSSGFLAFARHAGVLQAVEDAELPIGALVGTSSGALVGALWAAGHSGKAIQAELEAQRPWDLVALHGAVWRGAFSLDDLIRWLEERLPARFEDLERPLAVGVCDRSRRPALLHQGDLPRAVAASCAIPYVFAPVEVDGASWQDGGVVDRLMLDPWRDWRGNRPLLVHAVDRSRGAETRADLSGLPVVRTPKSGASFFNLGDVPAQVAEARGAAATVICGLPGRPDRRSSRLGA